MILAGAGHHNSSYLFGKQNPTVMALTESGQYGIGAPTVSGEYPLPLLC